MTTVFNAFSHPKLTLKNRLGLSPMSMYGSADGIQSQTETDHYATRAMGGTALVFTGTVAVLPEGRITPADPGLWDDSQVSALQRTADAIKRQGGVPAIQIGHAGRKASTTVPWLGGRAKQDGRSLTKQEGAWQTVAPSALSFGDNKDHMPTAMTLADIENVIKAFAAAARRADNAGFEVLEVHAAHGYLLHSFYSPLTNKREDAYGGSEANRQRLLLDVIAAVRRVWPEHKTLVLRFNMDDFCEGGMTFDDGLALAQNAVEQGVDMLDPMSFGGISPHSQAPWERNFSAEHVKALKTSMPSVPVMVSAQTQPDYATPAESLNSLLQNTQADVVLLGRQLLADPFWPSRMARVSGDTQTLLPAQYEHWLSGQVPQENAHASA